ncbi:MAG TPA: hypothetical protein VGV40_05730 [Solirubrobacteraceae bacterium]|nr:hypothetical protein [Solirubrobacteraceae bacterium]
MAEERERHSQQPDPGHPVAGEDIGEPEGGTGGAQAQSTQAIGDQDQNKEQTTQPSADDDVGKPDLDEDVR